MILIKTTEEILKNPWCNIGTRIDSKPKNLDWNYNNKISIFSINHWETIYFQGGNIGIYAAWDPYIEYYILTHNLFLNSNLPVLEFYGPRSNKKIIEACKDLKIEITPNNIWVDTDDLWLYD